MTGCEDARMNWQAVPFFNQRALMVTGYDDSRYISQQWVKSEEFHRLATEKMHEIAQKHAESFLEGSQENKPKGVIQLDYTKEVEQILQDRDEAAGEVTKTQLKIIRNISSLASDLAVIHTDGQGWCNRASLVRDLDKALRGQGIQAVDAAEFDEDND